MLNAPVPASDTSTVTFVSLQWVLKSKELYHYNWISDTIKAFVRAQPPIHLTVATLRCVSGQIVTSGIVGPNSFDFVDAANGSLKTRN